MQLHEKLKRLRSISGKTQIEVGEALAMTQSQYSKIENGQADVTIKQLEILATIFELELENIIGQGDQIVFNLSANKKASGVTINTISKNERKVYEDFIISLKEEISHLKIVIEKLLNKKS